MRTIIVEETPLIFDGLSGYTEAELDKLIKKAKALGYKVKDRRIWWNRIFRRKPKRLTGIRYNVKTHKYERDQND